MSRPYLEDGTLGLLRTPRNRYSLDGIQVWAMDNGCFTDGYPGDEGYMALLTKLVAHRDRCLFVAVPDVLGDGAATLSRFPVMAARIRAAGWPVALVAQDGMVPEEVPWGELDWLFVGGSTEWKLGEGARLLVRHAKSVGVRVHVGRVNSAKRFRRFAALGCDSADGTALAFDPSGRLGEVLGWITAPVQHSMF